MYSSFGKASLRRSPAPFGARHKNTQHVKGVKQRVMKAYALTRIKQIHSEIHNAQHHMQGKMKAQPKRTFWAWHFTSKMKTLCKRCATMHHNPVFICQPHILLSSKPFPYPSFLLQKLKQARATTPGGCMIHAHRWLPDRRLSILQLPVSPLLPGSLTVPSCTRVTISFVVAKGSFVPGFFFSEIEKK